MDIDDEPKAYQFNDRLMLFVADVTALNYKLSKLLEELEADETNPEPS